MKELNALEQALFYLNDLENENYAQMIADILGELVL